jgi:hypothetical protein
MRTVYSHTHSMSWKVHGLRFEGCATDYAFAINLDKPGITNQPRAEHNNFKLYDVSFGNYLEVTSETHSIRQQQWLRRRCRC